MNKIVFKNKSDDVVVASTGDLFVINGDVCMLACMGYLSYAMINLLDGNIFGKPFQMQTLNVEDVKRQVKSIGRLYDCDDDDYYESDVDYIGNKTITLSDVE